MEVVVEVVHKNVPRARPSPHAKRWWTADLSLLRSSLSSTRNHVTTLRRRRADTSEARVAFQSIRREYFRLIEKQKKSHWKDFLQDPSNIWKANRFTRIASQTAAIPTFSQGTVTAETDEAKVDMLMATVYPIPPEPRSGGKAVKGQRK